MLFGLCFMFVWALALGCIYLKTCGCYGGPYESLLNYSSALFLDSFTQILMSTLSAIILKIYFQMPRGEGLFFAETFCCFFVRLLSGLFWVWFGCVGMFGGCERFGWS